MAQRKTKQTEIPAAVADVVNAPAVVADTATAPKAKPVAQQEAQADAVQEDMQVGSPQRAYNQRKTLPMDMQVQVKNGVKGKLVYASKKTPGYTVSFDHFGSEEYIELGELVSARSSQPKFFQNNWFIIEDREVLEFLRVAQYYPEGYSTQYLDSIFTMSPSEIAEELHHLHPSLHRTVRSIAKERIDNGSIVDIRVIRAIEVALDCVLLN